MSETYDVFLSFRGEDTRHTFTGYLYDALRRKGIKAFFDDETLRIGEEIAPALLKAIEESRISFIVLSENYATSTWCLDELVKILECKKEKNQLVFPIFYKVEPSDVRHQRGSYGQAMAAHENMFGNDSDKVHKWRSALSHVSNLTGYHLKEGYEFKFIQDIVSKATTKVSPKQLHIDEHVVGLEFRVEELKSLLDIESNNTICMLGIHGTGGIGKTTLAKALYNSICNQFEGACFLFNVRETSIEDKGQVRLQQKLLSEMLEEGKIELGSVDIGMSTMKDRLSKRRVLLVLDDVDEIKQLEELAGGCDWFGAGSRIIITTRDKYLLGAHQVKKIYEMNVLNDLESLELFCQNAFKMSHPATNYEDLSNRAVRYAKGLPLALRVIGSNLIGKDLDEWKSALDKYEKIPHRGIQSILRISYDSLDCNEKDIFLDIACFFNGQRLEYVKKILDGCESYTEDGIRILVDRSLLTVEYGILRMHDLTQDMGREIVKQEAPKEASERSRLWFHEDVLEVLTDENTESNKIEGVKLDYHEEVKLFGTAFKKMKKLRILIVRNTSFSSGPIYLPNQLRLLDWKGYPSQSFPPGFYSRKIAALNLSCSPLVLEKPFQKFEHLTYMNFSYCMSITKFPDVSGAKNLRELILDKCKKLVKVDESVGFLPNLVYLSASECTHLRSFLPRMYLPSLKYLSFKLCRRLVHFPDIVGKMDKPLKINMIETAIKELPHSFGNLTGLNCLDMTSCKGLRDLPSGLFMLPNFVTLKIGGCSQLRESFRRFKGSRSVAECRPNLGTLHFSNASLSDEDLHVIIQSFPNLKDLNVSSNFFVSFPPCITDCVCLTSLDVSYCLKLQEIPQLPSSVQKVDARHCNSLTSDTSSMLWSQVRKDLNRLEVVMPKTEIPKWFDYRHKGRIPVFWARGKFPIVALAFVFEKVNCQAIGFQLFIDGERVHRQSQKYHSFTVAEDHVLLCDLRVLFSDEEEWRGLDARVGHDWKTVLVNCETNMVLRYWGVYVYKQETNMEDIQFTSPYPESSGIRCLKASTISRVDEEERSSTDSTYVEDSTTITEEEKASCSGRECRGILEDVKVLQDSNPHVGTETDTCNPSCLAILSVLWELFFHVEEEYKYESSDVFDAKSRSSREQMVRNKGKRKAESVNISQEEDESDILQSLSDRSVSSYVGEQPTPESMAIETAKDCAEDIQPMVVVPESEFSDALTRNPSCFAMLSILKKLLCFVEEEHIHYLEDVDLADKPGITSLRLEEIFEGALMEDRDQNEGGYFEEVPPSFSESLQTVVENLNRVMALKEGKGSGSRLEDEDEDDDSISEWLAETILSDEEEEGEGEA